MKEGCEPPAVGQGERTFWIIGGGARRRGDVSARCLDEPIDGCRIGGHHRQVTVIELDEVSMGLAPMIVDEIFTFLGHVAGEGVSLLVVEQYVHKALQIADYAYILSRGEVSFAGEAAELGNADVFSRYLGEMAESRHQV